MIIIINFIILSRIRKQEKTARIDNFLCLTFKITQIGLLYHLSSSFTFISKRSLSYSFNNFLTTYYL